MTEDPVNPYQAPAVEPAQAEPVNSWMVSGDYLLVRPGALLPPVALEGSGTPLTAVTYRFNVLAGGPKAMIASALPIVLVVGWINGTARIVDEGIRWTGGVVLAAIAMVIFSRFAKTINGLIWGFAPVAVLRKRSRKRTLAQALLWSGLFLLGATFLALVLALPRYMGLRGLDVDGVLAWLLPVLLTSLVLMIASVACGGFKPGLNCALFKDGWLYFKGVPQESLVLLGAKSMEPVPGKRMRKVYTSYFHQLPLDRLIGEKKWQLWNVLRLALWKAARSPKMERLQFHISERLTLPLAEADPALLEKWRKETAGTSLEEWTLVLVNRLESPQGDMRMDYAFHASPDRRHFSDLRVTRYAIGNFFHEDYQTTFRAWGEDGRSFFTSSPPGALGAPDHHDWAVVPGTLQEVWVGHLERLRPIPLRELREVEELVGRMEADAEDSARVAEAMGIQGPVREMELLDFPK